ncbi:MAG TPA: hypothetical protein VIT38_16945, partial [Allosphingosinicella sp.]
MRLASLLLTCATAGLIGVAAAAQDAAPPAGPPAKAEPTTGLSGLQDTVSQLSDEPQPDVQPPPAPAALDQPAPPPTPAPAPAAEAPAQTPPAQE